ncbi:TetR/AcrR family acrAB operon transcriptional repressor [Pararhizobium capsulatum DSM 1112]|uniref:TetR/AcrR family acrAB operon transcriptional repressor n=1 Tax=Pararhizobium capsulatum DSM 1112 TaxID=1121113 RepID=A0ABU0BKA1_9HYPH|nr:TetR family transcriptional regulator [Pararhizobium capsulatum]MDQ0318323.1 TetR/AcrR family acrAB operon transcriptional repressor [Pararhizobium capsulatum DSM 1112]
MRRTKAEAEETRQNILCAAERVFYEKGVSTATMEEVASAAGVTRGAIYWHFANKTDLFLELYNTVKIPQEDMIEPTIEAEDILGDIERGASDWLEIMNTDEQRQRILSILLRCDYSGDLAPVLERQQEVDDHHTRILEMAFERALSKGQMDARWTPQAATNLLRWTMKGLCSEWLMFGRRFDLPAEGKKGLQHLFASFRSVGA